MEYYLGIDIGASSGRHILGHMENGQLILEEIYRFDNAIQSLHGKECWDIDALFEEVIQGIQRCKEVNKIPISLSIDTWACDFVLLDEQGNRLCDCVSYRDHRVDGVMEEAFQIMDQTQLYQKTGIQFQKFNTLYQLLAMKNTQPELLKQAAHFLMVPDYLIYRLTGKLTNEYTNASTTQLVNVQTQRWDETILEAFNLPKQMFHSFTKPKEKIGMFTKEIQEKTGCNITVVECATHDTASAFASNEYDEQIIISSGTWSLLGTIIKQANVSEQARIANFTNEGSYDGNYRFLKNIMGLWLIQEVRHCLSDAYSFSQLVEEARKCQTSTSIIDVNDSRFLHPANMIKEIQAYCLEHNDYVPKTIGEIASCVYHSLAIAYRDAILELEELMNRTFDRIYIIGGGSQNDLLNELVEAYTGKTVIAKVKEATIIGNIRMQIREENNDE